MSKAEDLAKELYPDWEMTGVSTFDGQEESMVRIQRVAYIKGYHQAEKDLELTWEDVSKIKQIMFVYNRQLRPEIVENKASLPKDEEYCREVLNRFKKGKG